MNFLDRYFALYPNLKTGKLSRKKPKFPKLKLVPKEYWVGLDGEGKTTGDPWTHPDDKTGACVYTGRNHRYTSMSWRDANGKGDDTVNEKGLTTVECLDFILKIPPECKIMAYGFGYDLTKILEDLDTEQLYRLTHPHLRLQKFKTKSGDEFTRYAPVEYRDFLVDVFNTRFKVGRLERNEFGRAFSRDWRTVYDISKFYQCRFVKACENWDVGTPEEREVMAVMKDQRRNLGQFTEAEILAYSAKECEFGAVLAQKLDDACSKIGVVLGSQYYGAGSGAKCLMRSWGIESQIPELPDEVEKACAYAFFGGRFEIAIRGVLEEEIYDWDIASAYPYQITFLPCLLCGKWSYTTDVERVKEATTALVKYRLGVINGPKPVWGPFPFRDVDGTIPFPVESEGGWIAKDEFFAGAKMFGNVEFLGAWVYETSCNHRPFAEVPKVYLERVRIGKEGAGIVLKLFTNAIAGSIMQTVGMRKFYCALWAVLITSGTRAQNLEFMTEHERLEDVVMIATDGLWSRRKAPNVPRPRETGTDTELTKGKSLGSWEQGIFKQGVFMARPGIYFPLGLKDDDEKGMKDLKARGIGVRILFEHRNRILEHYRDTMGKTPYNIFDEDPFRTIRLKHKPEGLDRFIGMKGGITVSEFERIDPEVPRYSYNRRPGYGLWSLQRRQISFAALPKRNEGDGRNLLTRSMPNGQFSMPYEKGKFDLDDILSEEFGDHEDDQDDFTG